MPDTITANHTVAIEDVEYQKGMSARLYRPHTLSLKEEELLQATAPWTRCQQ